MGTNGGPWAWWTLFVVFNLALIYPFNAPNLNPEGLHVGWNGLLWSWGSSWRGRPCSLICRLRDFRSCGLLRGWLGDGGAGGKMRLLYRRLRWDRVGVWCNSPQEPIETFYLWSHHHFPHLPHPSVSSFCALSSNFCASSCIWLACCNNHNPWKKRDRQLRMECKDCREDSVSIEKWREEGKWEIRKQTCLWQ